ncbi:MAG: ferrochelatase [bacterium]|nr:ferrochelatase [bacterium]
MQPMFSSHEKIGVLIAQLGTPDAPTPQALRPYLREFLSDMRVIDYHPFVWQPILRGIILRTRPARSARLYQRIWMKEGSPLLVYSRRQAEGLQERLGDSFRVLVGMRYGNPSIASAMRQFEEEGIDRILIFSMFPQFSSTTTASLYDAVYTAAAGRRCPFFHSRKRSIPTLRFVPPYYDDPAYINALRVNLEDDLQQREQMPEKLIFSFHGIPNRYIRTGDPYRAQCERTAQLLAEAMNLDNDRWTVAFQSQFGPEKWLEPYTDEVIEALPGQGVHSVAITCPGFTADCLETLDEIGNEGLEQWEDGGGHAEGFHFSPCLNAHPVWLDAMAAMVVRESQGWVERVPV